MSRVLAMNDVSRFRSTVLHALGLRQDACTEELLHDVFRRRLASTTLKPGAYLRRLDMEALADVGDHGELAVLARELVVGETYFFRQEDQFRALAATVLPARLRALSCDRNIRILSAGCSTGEEAYTIAMVLHDAIADPACAIPVHAVDINAAALAWARAGQYGPWALRKTGPAMRGRWFRRSRQHFVVDPALRHAVRFERRNLARDDAALWRPGSLDVVFCRNVIMYFAPDQARALLARIARALKPGGYLFLGEAETLRGITQAFDLRHTDDAFYYQLAAPPASRAANGPAQTAAAVRHAYRRVATPAPIAGPAPQPAGGRAPHAVESALELYRAERFADARAALRGPDGAARPAGTTAALLEAMLLVHGGELAAAEDECRRHLAAASDGAGMRYVLALCREGCGDQAGAVAQSHAAVRLDPAFAMPWLHLGLAARRSGDRAAARNHLAQASALLPRESEERLLLFGGGFTRVALLAFCDAALRDCGIRP